MKRNRKHQRWILALLGWPVIAVLLTGFVLAEYDNITIILGNWVMP